MNTILAPSTFQPISQTPLFNKDRWHVKELGIEPDKVHSSYYLDFSRIEQSWLKEATKRFICFQSSLKSYSSCRSYIAAIARFSHYLISLDRIITPENITRPLVIGFFSYLKKKGFGVVTRRTTIIHLRTFHLLVLQENWLPWPERPLIYSSDVPKDIVDYPRYIPDNVIQQLKQSLHHLEPYMQRFIIILLETGRRISEVCSLSFNCLEQDNQGDWYMQVKEIKLKNIRLIPISKSSSKAIKEQQDYLNLQSKKSPYLFPARRQSQSLHVSARHFNTAINELAQKCHIKDVNGNLWRFQSHQFRHTVGTSMINNGVPQVMIQQYLGHSSPEMTARYAHIHNETLKQAFKQYETKMINIHGETKSFKKFLDARWLKKHIMSQALPNGLCTLPLAQKGCPHANACLTCAHFCSSKEFLPQHKTQLKQTEKIVEHAKANGWERIVEMNTTIANNLQLLITELERHL